MSVSILGMSEQDFWSSTPRKIYRLAKIHVDMNSPKKQEQLKQSEKHKNMTWFKVLD